MREDHGDGRGISSGGGGRVEGGCIEDEEVAIWKAITWWVWRCQG